MKHLDTFVFAMLAGGAISLGCVAFLASESKVAGAVFFTVGLFAVCTLGLNLFTGKVCYVFEHGPGYAANCCLIWLGNLAGAFIAGSMVRATRLTQLVERAGEVSAVKLSDGLPSVFILSIFCNVLIFLAVESYAKNPHELGKYFGMLLGVAVFVMAGFEHCVANMFYFTAAGAWSPRTLGYDLVMTLGNAAGGVLLPLCRKLRAAGAAP